MKSAVIFYSFSGNTKQVAGLLAECLGEKGNVDIIELKDLQENGKFLNQCKKAFRRERTVIQDVNYDLSVYDVICIGTPVWAFAPVPAINTYFDKMSGIAGKEAIVFTTHGSGAGVGRCQSLMQDVLIKQGAKKVTGFSIQQGKVKDRSSVLTKIKEITRLWPNG